MYVISRKRNEGFYIGEDFVRVLEPGKSGVFIRYNNFIKFLPQGINQYIDEHILNFRRRRHAQYYIAVGSTSTRPKRVTKEENHEKQS